MNVEQIKNINDLINLDPNKKIVSHKVSRLTTPGENYGSLMLSVDITVKTPDGTEELQVVAKAVPPNEYIQEVFNTQVTFRNEIGFYKKVVPLLREFQKSHGVKEVFDIAPKYHGSRLNLKNDESVVDADGTLVLENLKGEGYTTLDRLSGLDFDGAKLVLINLAYLHAVPLALKLQKPEVFEKEIKSYLSLWKLKEQQLETMKNDQLKIIENIEQLKHLKTKIIAGFDCLKTETVPKEPWGTLVHNDCWSNNNMFKLDGSKVVKSKMVDYQIISYGSPARDVVFFIFSSLKKKVIEENYAELLKLYHGTFIKILEELRCDTTPFNFEAFEKEINYEAKYSQFGHLAFMIAPIYAAKGTAKEIAEMSPENMTFNQEVSEVQREKFIHIFGEFEKRGWF